MTYDESNVFASILRGDIPSETVYEDEAMLCFMDIMPRSPGHCLVIPKSSCRNLLDASDEALEACVRAARKVAKAAMTAFDADGITLQQFSEAAGGQEVFHLHFHVLPRYAGVKPGPAGVMGDMDEIRANGEKLRAALKRM